MLQLNADGTVNLDSAERLLKDAEMNFSLAVREARRAEAEVNSTPIWKIAHGRALSRLEVARSNSEGAFEAILRARGAVHEALNPGQS